MNGGIVIRQARRRAGISQAELARRLRTRQSVIARWETLVTSPTFDSVVTACRACGFSLDWRLRPLDEDDDRVIDEQRARTPADRVASVVNVVALRRA